MHGMKSLHNKVVIVGGSSALSQRVVAITAADPNVSEVIVIDHAKHRRSWHAFDKDIRVDTNLSFIPLDHFEPGHLEEWLSGAQTVIYLGICDALGVELDGTGVTNPDAVGFRTLLDVMTELDLRHLVLLSSAMVYGPWARNPVPLTEDAPIRPQPGVAFAVGKAQLELCVDSWQSEEPNKKRIVGILRPTIASGEDQGGWLGKSPWTAPILQVGDAEPETQFVHLDDIASGIDVVRIKKANGAYNVAPDGWVTAEYRRDLKGPTPRFRLPAGIATKLVSVRWRLGIGALKPNLLPYTLHTWVVANDRLRALGWEPQHSNEEAFVVSHRPGRFTSLTARRRQELSLVAMVVVAVGGIAAAVFGVRFLRKRTK